MSGLKWEELVNWHTVPHRGCPSESRTGHDAISRPRQSERETALPPATALIVIVLLSLGLWYVIWLAVPSLASALL
jgi:hypothetical protein